MNLSRNDEFANSLRNMLEPDDSDDGMDEVAEFLKIILPLIPPPKLKKISQVRKKKTRLNIQPMMDNRPIVF